jgi:predicted anti-sigma-YlaC factor YlaD
MSVDQLRLAESAIESALVLGVTTLPAAWNVLDTGLAAVLGAMWLLLATGVYSLHAVTFDSFRITGQRGRPIFSYTGSEE